MEQPRTRYAKAGDASVAYQVAGNGPRDLILIPGFVSHLEMAWEHLPYERFMERLSRFARVIVFDKRGTGLSDPLIGSPSLEQRIDDIGAVMDAAGADRATVMGISEGAAMSLLFAALHPERVDAAVLYGAFARGNPAEDYPWASDLESWEPFFESIDEVWGEGISLLTLAPSRFEDEQFKRWFGRFERMSATPHMVGETLKLDFGIDIRDVLPAVRVPTLLVHRTGDFWPVDGARYMAEQIPDARLVELPGEDHWPWIGDSDAIIDEVEEFLTGHRTAPEPDRVLATVLFTDIVASTERAAALGDRAWREVLRSHDAIVRQRLERFRGREVKSTGDGVLATFDGPARAVRCARSLTEEVRPLGIEIRAGLHAGECELLGEDIGGIAVHTGARISALANPGEVLVSSTVKDLVAGSGIAFDDRGEHELKGVPGAWRLFAATAA
jgi:pimeloyl-ACP methyl ester carboxylesterase